MKKLKGGELPEKGAPSKDAPLLPQGRPRGSGKAGQTSNVPFTTISPERII